ncbi:G-patch domain and KOW motifs-containing protein-like [Lycorma delicatula]|uniref:G-patch domain and KOW motifs-containing protein-like n=1 Tax=Lycorma delicatula TaxID=130591 RepID=UPI003F51478B
MCDDGKKISFAFKKLAKPKVSIVSINKEVKRDEDVQFIDCVEEKSIKVKNEVPKQPELLVIPLPKKDGSSVKRRELLDKILHSSSVGDDNDNCEKGNEKPATDLNSSLIANKLESLDEIAAREIIEDLKKVKDNEEGSSIISVPLTTDAPLGEKESTLEDYESIPVDKFGMAVLRGMGWAPGKGIGKNEKVVAAKQPVLRPKGLGLGADKVIKQVETSISNNEPVRLLKGSFVRIIAGTHKDLFGEIIGFDDETGRLIVRMALGSSVLTFNEFMVQLVSKEDYYKNSKVINVKKYEEYKQRENSKETTLHIKHKESKTHRKDYSSNSDSSSDEYYKRKRDRMADLKKRSKKHKEKKKGQKHSHSRRSSSRERKKRNRSPSPNKHKTSKRSWYD